MSVFDWLSRNEPATAPTDSQLRAHVTETLRGIFDPEIPINIYDLGLVYGLDVDAASGQVHIRLTLTAPACPVAQSFPEVVRSAVGSVPGVSEVEVELVWEPRWTKRMMSDAARLELGLL